MFLRVSMNGAGQTGIVRTDHAGRFDGLLGIGERNALQRFFDGAGWPESSRGEQFQVVGTTHW